MRIACVGGGPAGLYFALLTKLRAPGHDITVFERSAVDSTCGWGVTFGGELVAELHRNDPRSAREIEQAAFRWVNQVVDVHGMQVQYAGCDGYSIERRHLLDIMATRARGLGVRIELGQEVVPSLLGDFDLIVACDGMNSSTRLAGGSFQTDARLGRNKYIWLGTDRVFNSFTYCFACTSHGWVWAYAYGTGAKSSTFIVECSPETWTGLGFDNISPHNSLVLLERLFQRHLDGHKLAGQAGQAGQAPNVRWLNFRTITNRRWYDGKIVLAGDAAHTTHYSIGSGTKLAIEDAIALAENLQHRSGLELTLRSYERQRQAALRQPGSEARFSAQWFEDISRYIDLRPNQFSMLLHGRRSPLLPRISPPLYCRLLRTTEEVAFLRELRKIASPKVKAIYSRQDRRNRADESAPSRFKQALKLELMKCI